MYAIRRFKRLPYTVRVLNFLAVLYAIRIGQMLTFGPAIDFYLMAPAVLAAILLGTRQALAVLAAVRTCRVICSTGRCRWTR